MHAWLFLTDGFEEIEALVTVDILRRAEINVQTVSLTQNLQVTGGHQVPVLADVLLEDVNIAAADMLIIPGGTTQYNEHAGLKAAIPPFLAAGKPVAAICAAPMVLGGLGLLKGKKATCYPSFEKYLQGADVQTGAAVVVDGNIITGRGPGLAMEFALQLVETLSNRAKRDEIAAQLLLTA